MNYKLVQQLKDAKFPFDFKESIMGDDTYTFPNLGDIIEACGKKHFVMWEYEGKFYTCNSDCGRSDIYFDDYPSNLQEGETMEEAVANLWLELNKIK